MNDFKNDESEINLYDLMLKIWKWKFLIVSCIVVGVLITYIYGKLIITSPEVGFTTTGSLKIGKIANVLVEQWPDIEMYLNSNAFSDNDPCLSSLVFNVEPSDFSNADSIQVRFILDSDSTEDSVLCIDKAMDIFIKRHNRIFDKSAKVIRDKVRSGALFDPIYTLDTYTYKTSVLMKPESIENSGNNAIEEKRFKYKLVIAFIASLLFGIFIAFFIDFIRAEKDKRNAS